MTLWQAGILSLIEGITEFLPISSTGHLILASTIMHIPQTETTKTFEIFIQLGAIFAVVVYALPDMVRRRTLWIPISIAVFPTALLGVTLYKSIKAVLLGNVWVTITSLFLGGIVLIFFEKWITQKKQTGSNLSYLQSFLIGCGQSLAMIPGVSRSAATIVTGMLMGMPREEAVKFSFYLAIPTLVLATGYDLLKSMSTLSSADIPVFVVGIAGSFVTAYITIRWFLQYVSNHTFTSFGIYRIAVSLIYALLFLT